MRRLRSSCSFVNRNSDSFPTGILDLPRSEARSSWPCGPDGVRALTQSGDGAMVMRRTTDNQLSERSEHEKDGAKRFLFSSKHFVASAKMALTPLTTQVQLLLHRGPNGFLYPLCTASALLISNTM